MYINVYYTNFCRWIHSLIWIWHSNFNKNPDFVYKGSNLTILDTKLHSWNSSPTKVRKKKKNETRKEQGEEKGSWARHPKMKHNSKTIQWDCDLFLPQQKCIPPAFFFSDAEKLQQIPGFIIYFFKPSWQNPASVSVSGCLSLHIHLFHFIQWSAGSIWQAYKLPATTSSTLALWS